MVLYHTCIMMSSMTFFDDLTFYRFNHFQNHRERIDRFFITFALNYAHQGRIEWKQEDGPVLVLDAPIAFWTWPDTRFSYHAIGNTIWEHYFVSFRGERPLRWSRHGLFPLGIPTPFVSITNPLVFCRAFERLHESLAVFPVVNPKAVCLLEDLLLQLHQQPQRKAAKHPRQQQILSIMRQIDVHPGQKFDVDSKAGHIGVTPAHFRRLFGLFAGCSPSTYVNRARMIRASSLLRTSDHPIKQVADEIGIPDVYYFTKLFKKQQGMPPGAYRRAFQYLGAD